MTVEENPAAVQQGKRGTLVPLVVAALAYFLIPRRPKQTPQSSAAVDQQQS